MFIRWFKKLFEILFHLSPFAMLGTVELANYAINAVQQNYDMILLQNHGQVVVGSSLNNAIEKAAFFELAAKIYSHDKTSKLLNSSTIQTVRNNRNTKKL